MKVHEYNEMMAYMLRPRQKFAIGGGVVEGKDLGSREGFSELYGPNIRLSSTGANTFEVTLNRGGKTYYQNFKFDDYGGKEGALKAATNFRDSVKDLPKATGKEAKGRPLGFKVETGQAGEIRRILNQFIKEGKTSFSNEDIKQLANKDLFDTDRSLVTTIDRVKKEPEFKNLTFVDARSQKSKADYYTDPLIRKKIKENYKKLKQESLAKLIFPDEPLTTSKSRLGIILSDMADKGEIERLAVGEASEERLQDFDPAPEAEKKARIGRRRRKKIDILGSKDYEKELFEFKKAVQAGLGLEKVKEGKFDPIDMGHQSSITQLKALKQRLRPEDLNPQFYKANQLGIQKYEGGVKTLESALDKKFYPEQKKLYKQAQKFFNAGKVVPEDLQNKIIKSNEDIQKFIDKTVKEYPLLKDRVNAITIDPINLDVKRGDNIFRQLGVGLVDKDLGDIKIGSIDDLTIKANLAEQTFREAVDAGLIDESTGRQKLNKFLNVRDPRIEELLKIEGVTTADKAPIPEATKTRNMFKRAGKLGLVGGLIASTTGKTAETGQMPVDEEGFTNTEKLLAGTTAGAAVAARKPILRTLAKVARPFGFPSVAGGFGLSQFVDINPFRFATEEEREAGKSFITRDEKFGSLKEDPSFALAGADLLLPELTKQVGIRSLLANPFGRLARGFTPLGIGLQGIELINQARKEQRRIDAMSPEEREDFIAEQESLLDFSA
jgi:hypothetical protein